MVTIYNLNTIIIDSIIMTDRLKNFSSLHKILLRLIKQLSVLFFFLIHFVITERETPLWTFVRHF